MRKVLSKAACSSGTAELKIVILTAAPDTEDETQLRVAFLAGVPELARAEGASPAR